MSSSILKDAENALSVRVVELKTSIRPTTTREPAEGSLVRAVLSTARQLHNEKAAITLSALAHRTRLSNNQVRGIVHDLVKRGYMEQGFQAGVYRMVPE
jgi:hypothetical protein